MSWRKDRTVPPGWYRTRQIVLNRDGGRCTLHYPGCTGAAVDVDHIVPDSRGGSSAPENLQAVCRHCHDIKTAAERDERNARRRLPRERHPSTIVPPRRSTGRHNGNR